jgi:DNA-directed RNA polymerase specialized sigma24 family protein
MNQVAEPAPTPDDAIEFEEELRLRLNQLPKPHYRQVVLWKLEGRSNEEIAVMLRCTTRSVERYLNTIRLLWADA